MKIYYAKKNKKKIREQDPDYFVYLPKKGENTEREIVGDVFVNTSRKGFEYLQINIIGNSKK